MTRAQAFKKFFPELADKAIEEMKRQRNENYHLSDFYGSKKDLLTGSFSFELAKDEQLWRSEEAKLNGK